MSVNELFTQRKCIEKLNTLSYDKDAAISFNFTATFPGVSFKNYMLLCQNCKVNFVSSTIYKLYILAKGCFALMLNTCDLILLCPSKSIL